MLNYNWLMIGFMLYDLLFLVIEIVNEFSLSLIWGEKMLYYLNKLNI